MTDWEKSNKIEDVDPRAVAITMVAGTIIFLIMLVVIG